MSSTEVAELLDSFRAGSISLQQLALRFRERAWPEPEPADPRTYLELAAAAQEDPEPDVPGSFDEVIAAFDRGELTWQQYRTLAHAVADAINAADEEPADGYRGPAGLT
jgi:hypothetical protein